MSTSTKQLQVGTKVVINGSIWRSDGTRGVLIADENAIGHCYYVRTSDNSQWYIDKEHVSKAQPEVKLVGKTWHCKL